MVTLTPGATYMAVPFFLMTWHLLTPINCPCWSTSLLLNPPKSPAFCPATLWSRRIGGPFNTCGAQPWQYDCWPFVGHFQPNDSWLWRQYNTHSSIKTTLWCCLCWWWWCIDLFFLLQMNNCTDCKVCRCRISGGWRWVQLIELAVGLGRQGKVTMQG